MLLRQWTCDGGARDTEVQGNGHMMMALGSASAPSRLRAYNITTLASALARTSRKDASDAMDVGKQ